MRRFTRLPLRVPKLHVFIGVAVGPTINRDRKNIFGDIEASGA